MPKKTEKLRSYLEVAKDYDRELRSTLVAVIQEEDAISRASGGNADDLIAKYKLDSKGN